MVIYNNIEGVTLSPGSLIFAAAICRYHLHEYGLGEHYNSIVPR